ncbi:aldose epimerase [Lactobacillus acetotolerans]|uniref:aldose epimerase family protein n=1 Tax=Lactobacillus acetotolerans TaxID=1600 RepID=UPI0007BA7F38|nr:aldose epimerase [Lactobacillus acetotolerans]QGV05134.1 aldose epimerase [Lactobacillus acetotolerans]
MQTIENSLLHVSIDENGAQMTNLISQSGSDYLKDGKTQEKMTVAFPSMDEEKNWAKLLPWTVVDKGDSRISLTLIDNDESYKAFPYHFEVVLTYALEGNRINVDFYLKNNSHKEMPFSLAFVLPIIEGWTSKEAVNEIDLNKDKKQEVKFASTNFNLAVKNKQITAVMNDLKLAGGSDQDFKLTLTLS